MIELKNINVTFNKGTKLENHVLKDINLKVVDGDFITIIGGNGAGKSTLMNLLSGDILPNSGQIFINGTNVTKLPTEKRSAIIARVFQDPSAGTYSDLTIEENMSLAYKRGQNRDFSLSINDTLREKFKKTLGELAIDMESRLNYKVSGLSGGQRQALSLVMATLQGSKLLLLDEHTAALDPKMAKVIMNLTAKIVDQHKLTTLMVTHTMTQAIQYGNKTIMMYHGEIAKNMSSKDREKLSSEDLIKYFDLN